MRIPSILFASIVPVFAAAAPVQFDVGDAHVIVIRPIDNWDPNTTTASFSLDNFKDKTFGFQYVDASGNNILPSNGGLFRQKVATPLSDAVTKIMSDNGFRILGSHLYSVSRPVKLDPANMGVFVKAQNSFFQASVIQTGDPAGLGSKVAAKKFANVLLTATAAAIGMNKLGTDAVGLSQYSTLYSDIAKLTGGANAALLPIPLPDYDFTEFSEVEVRRVTDNADHLGEIVIAYRTPKTAEVEQRALAQAIAAAGGVGTTVEEIETSRKKNYEQRVAIWAECQSTPACAQR